MEGCERCTLSPLLIGTGLAVYGPFNLKAITKTLPTEL